MHEQGLLSSREQEIDNPRLSPVCISMDQAEEVKKGIYSAGRYYCSCGGRNCARRSSDCPAGGLRISVRADIVRGKDGALYVEFRCYDKAEGRRYMIRRYGPDPSKWPYQAKARKLKEA